MTGRGSEGWRNAAIPFGAGCTMLGSVGGAGRGDMFRFLARVIGLILVAAGFVGLVIDGTKSIANSRVMFTPLGELAFALFPKQFPLIEPAVTRHVHANFPKSTDQPNLVAFFRQGTRRATVSHLQQLSLEATYQFRLSKRWSVGGAYAFDWFRYSLPRTVRAASQSFLLQSGYHF